MEDRELTWVEIKRLRSLFFNISCECNAARVLKAAGAHARLDAIEKNVLEARTLLREGK